MLQQDFNFYEDIFQSDELDRLIQLRVEAEKDKQQLEAVTKELDAIRMIKKILNSWEKNFNPAGEMGNENIECYQSIRGE